MHALLFLREMRAEIGFEQRALQFLGVRVFTRT